ncbi:uncharacterized protein PITG_04102 [Phytophthora infestans T30-4]|uniref:Uncharacterized protein n=1 Tax=Phytophthora infestans (strain T30-4) TaxID=403677 RepID=D0N0K1_PHYIT|nr:uncharacterized protein PITG_04102 [Phytophthora infestans T30-4]EEY67164.1 conserved hypothetical protein [Phytophthora infestans T30-4]|eukprot:XP_002905812.1 conserved hypothetical protein [Phytophthora infestans T30-4]
MKISHECAEQVRQKEQARQARYYNRRARMTRVFSTGDRVWMYRPPRGTKATKLVHVWIGPLRIIEPAGYDNYVVRREDQNEEPEEFIAHLEYEEQHADDTPAGTFARATTAPVRAASAPAGSKRSRTTVAGTDVWGESGGKLVEIRRRRRRNKAGQYVLELELRPVGRECRETTGESTRWVSIIEYDKYFQDDLSEECTLARSQLQRAKGATKGRKESNGFNGHTVRTEIADGEPSRPVALDGRKSKDYRETENK